MRRYLAVTSAALALAMAAGAPADAVSRPGALVAKSCRGSYLHAVVGGQQKCLRRGEFCAHAYQRQYRRYGFSCTSTDARGNYHLT
jgi:hypothetical protein